MPNPLRWNNDDDDDDEDEYTHMANPSRNSEEPRMCVYEANFDVEHVRDAICHAMQNLHVRDHVMLL
ncbi:unnamed protein product [Gongylonema pulchrum]|uniref:ATP-dependent RNA helicase DHX8 n=1 Tax=Gongylonema pulchrum TaxID=637853 RepID=A0A183DJ84_9BILA|nr:unnamed protein product [Gongylonema pulchrum]